VPWKLDGPLKINIFLWMALANKILTWDNGQKRGWNGLGWCCLCKSENELVDHLFVHCSFTKEVWKEMFKSFNIQH
jgi:hypothetical protein